MTGNRRAIGVNVNRLGESRKCDQQNAQQRHQLQVLISPRVTVSDRSAHKKLSQTSCFRYTRVRRAMQLLVSAL